MATRNDFDDFFGDDEAPNIADTRADGRLYRVPVGRLTANLVNPRKDFGTEDQLIDLGKSLARRQIQACPVVSRGAYLNLWPDHSKEIGDVDYVLVSGERRYRAATVTGLPALDCVVDDNIATDRKTFMEAVVSENVDRQNFDPIEEAYAVQALVAEFGSNRAVAQHFERVDGWVTQRILLTHLDPQMQTLARRKEIPLEAARTLGKLARDHEWDGQRQADWWDEQQEQRQSATAARKAAKKAKTLPPPASPPAPSEPAVPKPAAAPHQKTDQETEDAPAPGTGEPAAQQDTASAPSPSALPEPVTAEDPPHSEPDPDDSEFEPLPELVAVGAVPWGEPEIVYRLVRQWMRPENIAILSKLISDGAN